ncbi:hypothetical protein BO71DRAFT_102491 [Aspergillus ellipticus CBS 707.79]|uniref:Uncharacterized protein n=1 Tax=Aspergillus ellipticus CBS 707.79 TaxID=1448320 RepID=A0A319DUN8_9EURO|nr:hypothetical protein BO71DRAFT_102491 [Aspergillus ellipticus CBS 707.79]
MALTGGRRRISLLDVTPAISRPAASFASARHLKLSPENTSTKKPPPPGCPRLYTGRNARQASPRMAELRPGQGRRRASLGLYRLSLLGHTELSSLLTPPARPITVEIPQWSVDQQLSCSLVTHNTQWGWWMKCGKWKEKKKKEEEEEEAEKGKENNPDCSVPVNPPLTPTPENPRGYGWTVQASSQPIAVRSAGHGGISTSSKPFVQP